MTINASNVSQIVFIDSNLSDSEQLLAHMPANAEIFYLKPAEDGLKQIAELLKTRSNLDAIHILSHGDAGQIQLGAATLDAGNSRAHAAELALIGASLKANGDLLLYGCNIAHGDAGQRFIKQLADLTGADVAASEDLTGASRLGGDWRLEAATGVIETATIDAAGSYGHVLAVIDGTPGNDTLIGGDAADSAGNYLRGDAGNDTLAGTAGSDSLNGGDGIDWAYYDTATGGVKVDLSLTVAQNTVNAGVDKLIAIENLLGGNFNDILSGNGVKNVLKGLAGNDALNGRAGNDILIGGTGKDTLAGGLGADRFDFNAADESSPNASRDIIADFKTSEADKIDLATIDAKSATPADNAFTFIGTAAFSNVDASGQLRFDAVNHILYGSTDADKAAEFSIQVTGVASLAAGDFIL